VQLAYRSLVGRDRVVTRAEFWRMSPSEVWWLIEARQEQVPNSAAADEATRERAEGYRAEAAVAGFASVAEFWRARARQGVTHG
jgi:hypothetical protein